METETTKIRVAEHPSLSTSKPCLAGYVEEPNRPSTWYDPSTEEILFGHSRLTNIVGLQASSNGRATVFRRIDDKVIKERMTFTPWALISNKAIAVKLKGCKLINLKGNLHYRYRAEIFDKEAFEESARSAYEAVTGKTAPSVREITEIISLNNTEQFQISQGVTFYKNMKFEDVLRLQIDIETTGFNSDHERVFLVAISTSEGLKKVIHGLDEAKLLEELNAVIRSLDPDIIENHNIFGFDIPFLIKRHQIHQIPITWGRDGKGFFSYKDSLKIGETAESFTRYCLHGREIVDTLHAVKRYDAVKRELGEHGLKYVAKFFGLARDGRKYIDGDKIYETYMVNPDEVAEYALDDVAEVEALSRKLHRDKFMLSQMVPIQFSKVCTTGSTKPIELTIIRAYFRQNHSVPKPQSTEPFEGATVEVYHKGFFRHCCKIDVSSMYPSIIMMDSICPHTDPLGIFLILTENWTKLRLKHKAIGQTNPESKAIESALKILINSLFGYLANERGLFNNPKGAAAITKRGREILSKIIECILEQGGKPLEVDTDGVICVLPEQVTPRAFADKINNTLSIFPGVKVTADSEKPWDSVVVLAKKTYAILTEHGVHIVGAALKSRGMEPLFRTLMRDVLYSLLKDNTKEIHRRIQETRRQIVEQRCNAEDLVTKKKMGQSMKSYIEQTKSKVCHFEVMLQAGFVDAPALSVVQYFKSNNGYAHINSFSADDYDIDYYLSSLKKKLSVFRPAFTEDAFTRLINDSDFSETVLTSSSVDQKSPGLWINLAANVKRAKKGELDALVQRNVFVQVDDYDALQDFLQKHRETDVYFSVYGFLCRDRPSKARNSILKNLKKYGDFWVEGEGTFDDEQKTTKAYEVLKHIKRVLVQDFQIPKNEIKLYFNGGKSFYLRVSGHYFVPEPILCLPEKYAALMRHLKTKVPEDLAARIDQTIFDTTQIIRIPHSFYPGGGMMVEIPPEHEDLEGLTRRLQDLPPQESPDVKSRFMLPYPPHEFTKVSRQVFKAVTGETRFQEYRRSTNRQKDINSQIEGFLSRTKKIAPCLKNLSELVSKGESIGFSGRCKLIYEASRAGLSEDHVCQLFLLFEDPHRYGVLECHPNPAGDHCGYRLNEKFKTSLFSDCGCDRAEMSMVCDHSRCYRRDIERRTTPRILGEKAPTFEEFQELSRSLLKEFFDND